MHEHQQVNDAVEAQGNGCQENRIELKNFLKHAFAILQLEHVLDEQTCIAVARELRDLGCEPHQA